MNANSIDIVKVEAADREWSCAKSFERVLRREIVPVLAETEFNHIRRHRRTALLDTSEGRVFVKMYLVRKSRARQAIEFWLGRTRARAEWRNHLDIWRTGVPVPEPLAFSENLPINLQYTSLFIMRAMDPALVSLRHWIHSLAAGDLAGIRHAHREAVRFLASLHDKGLYHLDYTDVNVWGEEIDGRWMLRTIIDFEKFEFGAPENDRLACASLARASKTLKGSSDAEALRYFVYYLHVRGILDDKPRRDVFTKWLRKSAAAVSPETYAARSATRHKR